MCMYVCFVCLIVRASMVDLRRMMIELLYFGISLGVGFDEQEGEGRYGLGFGC